MFDHFTLAGLTISNLQAQVLGILGNPLVAACLLAMLALVIAPRITSLLMSIAGFGPVKHWDDDPDALANYWRGVHRSKLAHRSHKQGLDDRSYNDAV